MAIGNTMGLLNQLIQQNPNIQNQMFQPPMTSVSGGVNSFPNAFDPGSQIIPLGQPVPGTNPGGQFVQPTDAMTGGLIALPDLSQGMNKPQRPDPFGLITPDPGTNLPPQPNELLQQPVQNQMFRPPMQQPVQNQMPVANSFLEQLQQSAGLLQNQVTALQPSVINNVPQNRFVGNQFQMPFGMGEPTPFGGNYGSGGFNLPYNPGSYTPGQFNQYGNIGTTAGIDNIISSLLGPGRAMGRDKDQGASVRDTHEVINGIAYRINTETGEVDKLDGLDASIAKTLAGYFDNATISGIMNQGTYQDQLDRIKDISPEAYNEITANVREQARVAGVPETGETFNFGDFIGGLLGFNSPTVDNSPTGQTNSLGNTQAQQNAINDAVNTGLGIGYGQNEEGDYAGLVTNTNENTGITSNVQTGFNETMANAIQNAAAVAAIAGNNTGTNVTGGQIGSVPQGPFGIGSQNSGNNNGGSNSGGQQGGGGSGQSGPDAAGAAGSSFCFSPDTLIQMADGSEKEIQNIKLGDDTKGGKVELVVQTLGHNVYNYKGIEVSGSHWVVENGKYIEVETSKHAKPIDDKEMLYCLNTSDHAIWIKDIQFSDFIGYGLDYSVPGVNKFWESIKDKHTESIN